MTICYARPDRYEPKTIRCAVCKIAWDIDDPELPPCPRNHAEGRLEFATGLPFVDSQHKR